MEDLLQEFLTETGESISVLDVELVRLEQNPNDPELLRSIFRLVHTIKGTCGFLGLPRLEAVAHAAENVLGRFRDGELAIDPEAISLILASLDRIKLIVGGLAETQGEPGGSDEDLIGRLHTLASGGQSSAPSEPFPDFDTPAAEIATAELPTSVPAPTGPAAAAEVPVVPSAKPDNHDKTEKSGEPALGVQTIRVNVELLDSLMRTVSELVLTRNQLLQILRTEKDSAFGAPLQLLSHVTSDLQEGIMKTRMQPIGNAWGKLPRLIRDLSRELDKKIDLQMLGAETELDRQVLELIKDPLTHMVRNSADHGLETTAGRLAAGKSETGTVTLRAFHDGGHIVIEISDDGRGLNIERIGQKAVANGLVSEAELAGMSDAQICSFIFKPGFSTAAEVTSVSGRGVGMDVVRTNIEKIGGTIDLSTRPGNGTRFAIRIPLTLAIVSALIVESSGERFAVPQLNVLELVRISKESKSQIELINGTPVLRLRDRLVPLIDLQTLLRLGSEQSSDERYIVLIQVGSSNFGLIVDRVYDIEEIVVKPVARIIRHLSVYSGNTVLGDGRVIMILDPNGIAQAMGNVAGEDAERRDAAVKDATGRSEERTSFLLVRAGSAGLKAVPLSLIARLEEVDPANVELAGKQQVIQYRSKLIPLVPAEPDQKLAASGRQPVLVFADGDRAMGLLVDQIVDIVEDRLELQLTAQRPGVVGAMIIAGKAVEVVDTSHYLGLAFDDWFGVRDEKPFGEAVARRRILFVDDSRFFRNMLTPLLTAAGYEVSTVDSVDQALACCGRGEVYDVILSDIEMPEKSGFDLAAAVRSTKEWHSTPIVALSSHATPADVARGRDAGFTHHVAKLDRDGLLGTLSQVLGRPEGAGAQTDARQAA